MGLTENYCSGAENGPGAPKVRLLEHISDQIIAKYIDRKNQPLYVKATRNASTQTTSVVSTRCPRLWRRRYRTTLGSARRLRFDSIAPSRPSSTNPGRTSTRRATQGVFGFIRTGDLSCPSRPNCPYCEATHGASARVTRQTYRSRSSRPTQSRTRRRAVSGSKRRTGSTMGTPPSTRPDLDTGDLVAW